MPARLRPSAKAANVAHRERAIPYGLVASEIGISSALRELEANTQDGRARTTLARNVRGIRNTGAGWGQKVALVVEGAASVAFGDGV
jgi:hypothetical protein